MSNDLIKVINIPDNVSKQFKRFIRLELYHDRLEGKGDDTIFFFSNYMTIRTVHANIGCQYAQLVFITPENATNYLNITGLAILNDTNRILFCSGMFSYSSANQFLDSVYRDVIKAFNEYKANANNKSSVQVVNQVSGADELKKYKELMNTGIITEEEFEAKKKQILGL